MRHKSLVGRIVLALLFVATATQFATAQSSSPTNPGDHGVHPPDILSNYRFIPRHSTLDVSGGFAGVHFTYNLFGKFGIVTGYENTPPTLDPYAEFVDVRAAALLNPPEVDASFVPLERFVDLESLDGTFEPGDPKYLTFSGEDAQGAPFELKAVQHGRLLYMRGTTGPICCDYFQYRINAFAHLGPYSDFDFNGRVDRNDLSTLISNLGMTTGAMFEDGDADGDGDVDAQDFFAWQRDTGMTIDMSAFDGFGDPTTTVPEPASMLLSLLGILPLMYWRKCSC